MNTCCICESYFVCDSLHQQYSSYGPACCLAKRWMSAQLLDPYHFPEMCVELLVASLYLMPAPYQPPNQPQLGFFRFLHLLAHTNWNSEPVILNLNSEMTSEYFLVLIIKTNELHCFPNLFWYRTLHVSDRFTVHLQASSTVYTAIGICHGGYAGCLLARSGWNSVPSWS